MPLHDWTPLSGWEGVQQIWMVELLYWIKPRLPAGYRAFIGTTPTFAISANPALMVECQGRLIAALELVSLRNKDRSSACDSYVNAYAGYLLKGVHLLLVDVHRGPLQFSFADRIAAELNFQQPTFPAPYAISYRVGEPAPNGGHFLALWRRALTVGEALPLLLLPLSVDEQVLVDLEQTYMRATSAAYLS